MHDFLQRYDCIHESWSPLWAWKFDLYENEVLINVAEKYDKTVAQIMLKYFIQNDIIVIPKTSHLDRMRENFDIFDFSLDVWDLQKIRDLDQRISYTNWPETMLKEQSY